jgi:HEPN domain-containing protein
MVKQANKPRQPKPVPDFRQMYQLAERYSEASELLEKQARGTDYGASAPMVLVDSFAVELYLKCLFVLDNNEAPQNTHDWKELFKGLKPHTKTIIREAFEQIVQKDDVLRNLAFINPEAPEVTDFNNSLEVAARTFDKRRYLYEDSANREWFYAHLIRNAIRNVTKLDIRVAHGA